MTIIKFLTREERAFAELVEEGKKLEGQGFFVVIGDDEKVKPSSSANIIAFQPSQDDGKQDQPRRYLWVDIGGFAKKTYA